MINEQLAARLQAIGLTPSMRQHIETLAPDQTAPFLRRITQVQRDALTLHDGDREHPARALPALLAQTTEHDGLAVGDWVFASCNRHGQWWVHQRVPPLSQLARRLHDGRDKVTRATIVSNVDTALLVMGLDHDYNLRRLERYIALARLSQLNAVVVLTKVDLCDPVFAERRLREVWALLPPGIEAVALNGLDHRTNDALAPWLAPGRTLVVVGSSGAGKSTLTNTLLGETRQDTGANRLDDGRGRHTTTARSLHVLPGGACIIDTPGLRTLRLDVDADTLGTVFDDIAQLSCACRFRDCRHQDEPGCAVREQAPPDRLRNFQKLQREILRDAMSALERKDQRNQWKVRHKAARARDRAKREVA
ncbi:MAG: ribosome small subunit-dependent GTPase A [Rubrivivax sp.]|nr:ribosome small subunit-dependent GTPase A [Rubrivivax sp.]